MSMWLSRTDTVTDIGHNKDTDTPTPLIIIFENHVIQCSYICRCQTRHVSETGTHLIQEVSVFRRYIEGYIELFGLGRTTITCF